ncbi:DUF2968 domain-containing protein [Paraburkholderia lycopersici]|uniref:DUF2968 domain-containing protein n=1 Tax=Paraburkholderia lycopersici TaxID=416944 RepID=A0A1G6J4Y8_9BURK|nr:DUF2968 domain-containing protein [Paraburkholderia lycopersici]SDC13800.1 Protein of unknown function [Paraburkholderia lycopersici]
MKSILNRRNVALSGGPSRLLAVAHDAATQRTAAASDAAAHDPHAASASGSPADSVVEIESRAEPAAGATLPGEGASGPRPVSTLHAVPVMPAHLNGRPVQIADGAAFEALRAADELTTFRVYRCFAYTVSLFFHPPTLGYFVALHQESVLWRALKANDLDAAGSAFHLMQEQATRLADGETRRAQLVAQNAELARLIEESETQAERLRVDLQRHSEQEQTVTGRQHQVRKEVAQLEAQRIAAQAQLNKAHRALHQLKVATSEGVPHLHAR